MKRKYLQSLRRRKLTKFGILDIHRGSLGIPSYASLAIHADVDGDSKASANAIRWILEDTHTTSGVRSDGAKATS